MSLSTLPVAVIGAGPVGLAAAAHLLERGEAPIVFEAGEQVGANIRDWGHVLAVESDSRLRQCPAARSARLANATRE